MGDGELDVAVFRLDLESDARRAFVLEFLVRRFPFAYEAARRIADEDFVIVRREAAGGGSGQAGNLPAAQHGIELGCLFTAAGSDLGILARASEQLAARFKR
jgi:hypothetical protein